ncbi:MAG: hypothetical protein SCK28_02860 [Bacillota bacterium]|nr:hypothetical protein [Bacillota bacterium]
MLPKVNLTLTDRDKKLLKILAVVVFLAACFQLVVNWYLPKYNDLKTAVKTIELEVAQLETNPEKVKQLEEQLAQEISQSQKSLDLFFWNVLYGEPSLVLTDTSGSPNLHLSALAQSEPMLKGPVWQTDYSVSASGSYEAVYDYLENLDFKQKALFVNKLSLIYPHSFERQQPKEVMLDLTVSTFGDASYQSKVAIDPSWEKEGIFDPSVYAPPIEPVQPVQPGYGNNQGTQPPKDDQIAPGGEAIKPPRYDFPEEEEVR